MYQCKSMEEQRENLRSLLRDTIAARRKLRMEKSAAVSLKSAGDYRRLVAADQDRFDAEAAMCATLGLRYLDGRNGKPL